jgi:hypothetical protein
MRVSIKRPTVDNGRSKARGSPFFGRLDLAKQRSLKQSSTNGEAAHAEGRSALRPNAIRIEPSFMTQIGAL